MSTIKVLAAILLGCLTVFTISAAATTKPAACDLSKFDVVYDQRQKAGLGNLRINTDGILVALLPHSALAQGSALLEAGDLLEDYPELVNLFNEEFGLGSSGKPTQESSSSSSASAGSSAGTSSNASTSTSPSPSSASASASGSSSDSNGLSTAKPESTSQAGAKFKSGVLVGSNDQVEKKRKFQNAANILKSLLRAKVTGEN